jgi:hypothetical protein
MGRELLSFTRLLGELHMELTNKKESLRNTVGRNPQQAYKELNQIASMISAKYNVLLQFHFPDAKKINDVDSYGKENIGIVVDKYRKRFPIRRDVIKEKAKEMIGKVETKDAYMYEGKEGLKMFLKDGRMDILPGSVHLWCRIDDDIRKFVDWFMLQCYGIQ